MPNRHFWRLVTAHRFVRGEFDGAGKPLPGLGPHYVCELECGHEQRAEVYDLGRRGGVRNIRPGPPAVLDCYHCGVT